MNPPTQTLITLTLFLAVFITTNANAEITCADYPDKDLIILLDESSNNVSLSEYIQNSDLKEGWSITSSYDFSEEEAKQYVKEQDVVSWSSYYRESYEGMHFQSIEVGDDTAYVLIEMFNGPGNPRQIYQKYLDLYGDASNVKEVEKMNSLGVVGYGARISRGSYVIVFIDNNDRLIHISSLNESMTRYIAEGYSNLKNSLIVSGKNHWVAEVCKAQTDECTRNFYFSSDYDNYKLVNCSTTHAGKKLACPENRIEKYTSIMKIPFSSCEKGDILDISYEKTTEFPIKNKFWSPMDFYFQDVFPVEKSILKLEAPNGIPVKQFSTQGVNPIETKHGTRITYIWEKDSVEPFEAEELTPPMRELIPRAGYTSLQSWDEVRTWFEGLFSGAVNKEAVKNKVKDLIAGKTTDEEKSKEIYNWVRDQIRYEESEMGFLTGYKPHSAGDVLNYKFGDCKDHSILLVSMLQAAGIKSYPVLVSVDKINVDAPTPYEFYHSIVAVPNGSDFVWLDPTCKYCPYGFIDEGERDSDVLMLSNPSTTFTKIPVNDKDRNYQSVINYTIFLRGSGNAELEVKMMKTGSYGLALKEYLKDADRKTVKEDLDSTVKIICSDYDLGDYSIINSSDDQILLMDVNVTCNNLASKSGNKTVYSIPTETLFSDVISKEQRKYPILLKTNDQMILNIEFRIPEGQIVELMPESYLDNSQFATYSFNCSDNETSLMCKREFKQKAIQMPASDFEGVKKFFGKINALKRTVILSPTPEKKVEEPLKKEEVKVEENQTVQTQAQPKKTENPGGIDMTLIIGGVIIVLLVIIVVLLVAKKKK